MSSTIAAGGRAKLRQYKSIWPSPMRASARQSARFSSRDSVGWLIRSAPLSGARPTAIFRAGSERNASTSSQSSYPAAIMTIRAIAISE
jgi:hypothetical protein